MSSGRKEDDDSTVIEMTGVILPGHNVMVPWTGFGVYVFSVWGFRVHVFSVSGPSFHFGFGAGLLMRVSRFGPVRLLHFCAGWFLRQGTQRMKKCRPSSSETTGYGNMCTRVRGK